MRDLRDSAARDRASEEIKILTDRVGALSSSDDGGALKALETQLNQHTVALREARFSARLVSPRDLVDVALRRPSRRRTPPATRGAATRERICDASRSKSWRSKRNKRRRRPRRSAKFATSGACDSK
jgi:hypothetical protein